MGLPLLCMEELTDVQKEPLEEVFSAVLMYTYNVDSIGSRRSLMRQTPIWPLFEAVAPTLAYDNAIMGNGSVPTERLASIAVPTLVIDGGASPAFMHNAAQAVAHALPNAQHRTLEGQTHDVAPEALAPVLMEFFMETKRYM